MTMRRAVGVGLIVFVGLVLVERHVDLGLQRRIELPPDIVDADHDRKPIRLLIQHVGLPARGEIAHGVAAGAHVHHAHMLLGQCGLQQAGHQGNIAVAKRVEQPFTDRPGALAVGDRVADHQEFAMWLDAQGHW